MSGATLSSAWTGSEGDGAIAWYCLRTQPKHEHIAAARLRADAGLDVFCPRLRFKRATKRGAVWFVEAMFPGYLFAKFPIWAMHRQVQYTPGISSILRFGDRYAFLEETDIQRLREFADDDEVAVVDYQLNPGQSVRITEGAFTGIEAVITQLLPPRERVRVLLEFLGRSIQAEIPASSVLPTARHPLAAHG